MKYANDILTVAKEVVERRAEEEARKMAIIREHTIEFCESVIASKIEESALDGKIETDFIFGADGELEEGNPRNFSTAYSLKLSVDYFQYANGEKSYDKDIKIHLGILIEYLTSYGYAINIAPRERAFKTYGDGWQNGYVVTIMPNPQLSKSEDE